MTTKYHRSPPGIRDDFVHLSAGKQIRKAVPQGRFRKHQPERERSREHNYSEGKDPIEFFIGPTVPSEGCRRDAHRDEERRPEHIFGSCQRHPKDRGGHKVDRRQEH